MAGRTGVAIAGIGRIGRVHGDTIYRSIPDAEVVAVADPFVNDEGREWAEGIGCKNVFKDYRDLLKEERVRAVIVCSSTDTHAEISIAAAQAGRAVFCEKPIDHDLGRIRAVLAAVEKADVPFQVGFNRRFDRNFRRIREAVANREIGDLHIVKITSRDPAPPPVSYIKVSGGLFMDMMIHDFDMARYIAGCEVVSVSAAGAVLVDKAIGEAGDIDTALVTLVMKNGVLVNIDNSRRAVYGYDQRLEAFGSGGAIEAANEKPNLTTLSSAEGVKQEKPLHFFLERYAEAYGEELRSFFRILQNGGEVEAGGKDGLESVRVAMAAKLSLREKRTVLLSEIP